MNVRYWVELSQAERGELTAMLSKGKRAARKLKRAQILLPNLPRGRDVLAAAIRDRMSKTTVKHILHRATYILATEPLTHKLVTSRVTLTTLLRA